MAEATDTIELTKNTLHLLFPNYNDVNSLLYSFIIILIAGFLSLTLCYIIMKRDQFWLKLDVFSKSALSLLVGIMSYLVINLAFVGYRIIENLVTGNPIKDATFNYMVFIAIIIYGFTLITFSFKFPPHVKKKYDKLYIINFIMVSGLHFITIFMFIIGSIFTLLFVNLLRFDALKAWGFGILILGLIMLYFTYNLFASSLYYGYNKKLPFTYGKEESKLKTKQKK